MPPWALVHCAHTWTVVSVPAVDDPAGPEYVPTLPRTIGASGPAGRAAVGWEIVAPPPAEEPPPDDAAPSGAARPPESAGAVAAPPPSTIPEVLGAAATGPFCGSVCAVPCWG